MRRARFPEDAWPFSRPIRNAIIQLQQSDALPPERRSTVDGIEQWCDQTGFVTAKQISTLGYLHKTFVMNGVEDRNGWWRS